jgi:hypothetical protein
MKRILFLIITIAALSALLIAGCANLRPSGNPSPEVSANANQSAQSPSQPAQSSVQPSEASGPLTEADVPYAGDMVENLLTGIREKDLAKFSRDLDDTMKSYYTESAFNDFVGLLETKIGDYESKAFGQAAKVTQNSVDYTVVIYAAKYSKESGDVIITVSFSDNNGVKQVAGLYFNSPKLRAQ